MDQFVYIYRLQVLKKKNRIKMKEGTENIKKNKNWMCVSTAASYECGCSILGCYLFHLKIVQGGN